MVRYLSFVMKTILLDRVDFLFAAQTKRNSHGRKRQQMKDNLPIECVNARAEITESVGRRDIRNPPPKINWPVFLVSSCSG